MNAKDFSDTKPFGLYESAIGDKNQDYYLGKFEDFDDKGPGLHASWNWAAFFFTGFWALYRKMYGWFFTLCAIGTVGSVLMKVPSPQIQQWLGFGYIACFIGFGAFANALYHRNVKALIAAAQKSSPDVSRVSRRLTAGGGVNKWVPLVCGAVPVIGVVAAIALPAYQDYTKRQTVVASVGQVPVTGEKPIAYGTNDYPSSQATNVNTTSSPNFDAKTAKLDANESTPINIDELRALGASGNILAQNLLGMMYDIGDEVPRDYSESFKWHRLAANQGNASSQGYVGRAYELGHGVIQDYSEALRWYRLGAIQGNSQSQGLLGGLYATGKGVPTDYVVAHMWLNLSISNAEASDEKQATAGRKFLDVIASSLTPQQIAQAQQMARTCQQRNFKNCN